MEIMDIKDRICWHCKHAEHPGCKAFPISMFEYTPEFIRKHNRHDKPIKGQVGDYVFEPIEKSKEKSK